MDKNSLPALSILTAFISTIAATDIYLPSMPEMVNYFGVTDAVMRLTIPAFFIGSFAAAAIWGTISDHIGRRPTLLLGLSLFLAATVLCAFAPSYSVLFAARFVQGMGSVAAPVVGWAAIQDLYPANKSAKVIAYFGAVMTICPMIAPTLGGFIDVSVGWRWNFGVIAVMTTISLIALFFVMTEPRPVHGNRDQSVKSTLLNYWTILTHRAFLCSVMTFAFLVAGEWCFLTLGPFYFGNTLELSPDVFGIYITISGLGYILGTFLTPRVMEWVGLDKTMLVGMWFALLGCAHLVLIVIMNVTSPIFLCFAIGLFCFGASMAWGPSTSKALQCFEHIRGAASAVRGLILTTAATFGGFVGSRLDYSTLIPLIIFLIIMTVGSLWMFYLGPKEEA
jgi:DHA1 family bicyclomycin/chloramphenicol resistance-like MFS transporter